jgi:hypothetical protein
MDLFESFSKMTNQINSQINQDIDINKIMDSELQGVVDFKMWMETVELQKEFNNSVAPGWQTDINQDKYDYWMAITDEAVEVLGSKHWKWWKDNTKMGEIDWDNVNVELIDLFLFTISIAIQQDAQHIIFSQLVNMEMNKETMEIKPEDFFDDFRERFLGIAVANKNLALTAVFLVEFWYKAGGTANQLFMEFRVKSALNKIRQEYGYGKKNSYHKMWLDIDTGKMVEDNVIAAKMATKVDLDDDTISNIYNLLETYYLEHVAI